MSKVAKATIMLMVVTMVGKIFGFGREIVLTSIYGASSVADVYITSLSIPGVLFSTIAGALATTFIPLFYEVDQVKGRNGSLKFANNVFNVTIIISCILAIFGFIFVDPLVKMFAMNFTGEKLELAIRFTRIMLFGIIFIGLSQMMSSWLQINNNFTVPGMVGLPYNIIIIIAIFFSSNGNINIMAIGTLIAIASQFLFQLPFAIKSGYRYKPYVNLKDEYITKMIWLIGPVFIGGGVNQINTVVDRSLASTLGDGVITILNSANRLNGFVLGIFIATISAVIYPTLSKLSNENNKKKFGESVAQSINTIILLTIPISAGAIVLAEPIVRVVFERGAFNSEATHMTAVALAGYSIGMVGFGLRDILSKVFYSLKDTKTPMVNGALAMIMNILLNIISIKYLGYIGLALATSISSLICIVMLLINLKKKIGYFGQDKILKTMFKSLIAASFMGIVTLILHKLLYGILGSGFIQESIALSITIASGALVYGLVVIVLKVEEIDIVISTIKNKLKIN